MNEWMDGWINEWMDEWMNEWMVKSTEYNISLFLTFLEKSSL